MYFERLTHSFSLGCYDVARYIAPCTHAHAHADARVRARAWAQGRLRRTLHFTRAHCRRVEKFISDDPDVILWHPSYPRLISPKLGLACEWTGPCATRHELGWTKVSEWVEQVSFTTTWCVNVMDQVHSPWLSAWMWWTKSIRHDLVRKCDGPSPFATSWARLSGLKHAYKVGQSPQMS